MVDPSTVPLNPSTFDDVIKLVNSGGSLATIVITWAALRAKTVVTEIVNLFKTTFASLNTSMRDMVHEIRNLRQEILSLSREVELLKLAHQTQSQSGGMHVAQFAPRKPAGRSVILPDDPLPGEPHHG